MHHKLHGAHLAVIGGAAWIFLFALIARAAAVGREMIIALNYGTGPIADGYLFAINLMTWPVSVWFGVLSVVLVPALAAVRDRQAERLSKLMGMSLIIGGVLGIAAWLGMPFIASVIGLSPPAAEIAGNMAGVLSLLLPLGFGISLYSVWIMSAGNHANTLMEGVPPLVIAVVLLSCASSDVAPLVWSTVVGYVLHFLVLAIYIGRHGELSWPQLRGAAAEMRVLWRSLGLVALGQTLSTTTTVIDQIMAAPLGSGAIATLGYANRILILVTGLSALVITRAALPIISSLHAQRDPRMRRITMHWAAVLFMLGAAAAAVGYWIGPVIVPLLFQGGAFTSEDIVEVAHVLILGLPQLPFFCAGLVLAAQLAATKQYWAFAAIGSVNVLVKFMANWLLIPQFGLGGITLASAAMYAVAAALSLWVVSSRASSHTHTNFRSADIRKE